jgi:hypothetical protein
MNNEPAYLLLSLSFLLLNSCAVQQAPSIAIKPAGTVASNINDARVTRFLSKGDIYKTTYQLCPEACDFNNRMNDRSFYSWGKPSAIGILYLGRGGLAKKMPVPNSMKEEDLSTASYVSFKSKGNFEVLMNPLKDEAFAISSIFGRNQDLKINIISIQKVTASQLSIFPTEVTEIEKKRGRDHKPQQIDEITWQEGQPPQIIGVRKW